MRLKIKWPLFGSYKSVQGDCEKTDQLKDQDFKDVFCTEKGQRVLSEILQMSGIFHGTLSSDRATRDMIDGKRELAMSICERCGYGPDALADGTINNSLTLIDEVNENGTTNNDSYAPQFRRPITDGYNDLSSGD